MATVTSTPPTASTIVMKPSNSMRRVVVDRDFEQGTDRFLKGTKAAVRELLGMPVGVPEQRVELRAEHVAVAERRVDKVARDRQQRDGRSDRIERGDHHRVGQGRGPVRHGVHPDEQDVDPLAVAGRSGPSAGFCGEALAGEDRLERLAEDRAVAEHDEVRERDEQRDDHDAGDARSTGRSLAACVQERLANGEQAPGEDQQVERQEHTQHLGRDDPGDQPGRRLDLEQEHADKHQRERRDQRTAAPAATVD